MLFRAFYALPDSIKGKDGQPVNALLGTANLILREVEEHSPRAVVLCFGPDAADYRLELFDGYHAERPEVPDRWRRSSPTRRTSSRRSAGPSPSATNLEADDLLGAYARREADAGGTRPRDDRRPRHVPVRDRPRDDPLRAHRRPRAPRRSTRPRSGKRYGVPPELVPDFIALRGDPSDGIPGAKGIGEKGAADLLKRHGSLEAALDGAMRETKPRVRTALTSQREELLRFKEIATLRDVDVELPADRELDRAGAAAAARERGMDRLAARLEPQPS